MHIETDLKLDFRDVLIRPKRSVLTSRSDADVTRTFRFLHSKVEWSGFPLIASNMDTIGTFSMAKALGEFKALVALHKYYSEQQLVDFFRSDTSQHTFFTIGTSSADWEKLAKVKEQVAVPMISIDVANGYTQQFLDAVARLRSENPNAVIMAGTVVTAEMTEALLLAGADIVRIGIGSGSVCTTRDLTGVGFPQLSAVMECADAAHGLKGHVCSDGGCAVPGDIVKAIGGGADFVMLGGMLAGHYECEGEILYEGEGNSRKPMSMIFYGMQFDLFGGFPGGLTEIFWNKLQNKRLAEIVGQSPQPGVTATTYLAYCDGKNVHLFKGSIEGVVAKEPRGPEGFQWDPIFIPKGSTETFAEMGDRKNNISMRKLRADVLRHPVLFIGYSLSDINVRYLLHKLLRIWREARHRAERPSSHIFMTNPNPVAEAIFQRWGVHPIIEPTGHPKEGLRDFLREITPAR